MAKLASFVPIKVKSIKSLKRTAACKETKYIQPSQLQNLQRTAK